MKINSDLPFVPVLLGTEAIAYGVARSLHEAYGAKSIALGVRRSRETMHSKIVEVHPSPAYKDGENLIDAVLSLPAQFPGKKLMVIPLAEAYTNAVLEAWDRFGEEFILPVPNPKVASLVYTKGDFYRVCERFGVPHPETVLVTREDMDAPDWALGEDWTFPVIVKPSDTGSYPRLHFEGQKKIYRVHSQSELVEVIQRAYRAGYDGEFVIQQYIHGDEAVLLSVSTYSDSHGKMKLATAAQVTLTAKAPLMIGNNDAMVTTSHPAEVAMLEKLLNGIQYSGPANFDLMYDGATDRYLVLEINLRQGSSSYYATLAGANIPAAYVEDLVYGKSLEKRVTTDEKLWATVPLPVALCYSPRSLRKLIWKAWRHGHADSIWYWPDMSPARFATLLRVMARQTLYAVRYSKAGINTWDYS